MTPAIIGIGIVGQALSKCYKKKKIKVQIKDINGKIPKNVSFLNICIPYSEKFNSIVIEYIKKIKPQYVIIHSSVPCGTADIIAKKTKLNIVSSPVRGSHNNMYKSIKTFIKYIGCNHVETALYVHKHFKRIGLKSKIINSNKTVELLKLLCTTYYGVCIKWHDSMLKFCKKTGVSFNYVQDWNDTYNQGYSKLNGKQYNRPILYPSKGRIGGNCIIPNALLIKHICKDKFIDILINNI